MHSNGETLPWVHNLKESDTQHIFSTIEQRQTKWNSYMRNPQSFQPPSQSWSISQSNRDINPFQTFVQPLSLHFHSFSTFDQCCSLYPLSLNLSTTPLFHLRHQLVFIPCPLQKKKQCPWSRPFQLIVSWPCKKSKGVLSVFNYSCAMRGSCFTPLQAKKKAPLQ